MRDVNKLRDGVWLNNYIIDAAIGSMINDVGLCGRAYLFSNVQMRCGRHIYPEDIWTHDLMIIPYNGDTGHWSVVFALNPQGLRDGQVCMIKSFGHFYAVIRGNAS